MKSCLVVDDSSLVRKLAVSMLAGMGFTCREAADGQAAMQACADDMPDLILLDWSMPVMDGITFMRSNRPLPVTPALYEPSIVIVIQGRKSGLHDGNLYVYDAQHYLVLALPLPFAIETEATAEELDV